MIFISYNDYFDMKYLHYNYNSDYLIKACLYTHVERLIGKLLTGLHIMDY